MFPCKMTVQELIAEQLGHCAAGVMESSLEQLSRWRSISIHWLGHRGLMNRDPVVESCLC